MGAHETLESKTGVGQGADRASARDPSEALQVPTSPFGDTVVTAWHVPRPACDASLDRLEAALVEGRVGAALVGPPGIGKTHLMRLLCDRLKSAHCSTLYLPYAGLIFEDLCAWVVGLLGVSGRGDPVERFTHYLAQKQMESGRLVLVIDDANSMPLDTARSVAGLLGEWRASLRVGLSMTDDAQSSRVLAAFGDDMCEVRHCEPMTESETRSYVAHRLSAAKSTPETRERFTHDIVSRIHALAAGRPRRVHTLAHAFLDTAGQDPEEAWARLVEDEFGLLALEPAVSSEGLAGGDGSEDALET